MTKTEEVTQHRLYEVYSHGSPTDFARHSVESGYRGLPRTESNSVIQAQLNCALKSIIDSLIVFTC